MDKYINRKTKEINDNQDPYGSRFIYKNIFGRIILKLATKRFVSRLAGVYLNRKISKKLIKNFIIDNHINMDEYQEKDYKNFNQFFSRKIKDGKRPFSKKGEDFCAPCDSNLIVYKIDQNLEFVIKGKKYTIKRILRDEKLAKEYENGYFLVFRLSVDDYHRYSYIDDGKTLSYKNIKGKFHTTSPIAFDSFKVYEEAQREYNVLETKNFGQIVQMEIGALLVGKIVNHDNYKECFKRGEEKGYFLYGGSTVAIMVKENVLEIDKDILDYSNKKIETKVKLGEKVAKRL